MSKTTTIHAEIREDVGKGASRRLRHAGMIPAVIYGGHQDPVSLTLEHREILHATENESFFSSIMEIEVGDGRTQQVVVRDMQRHPFKRLIMHLDFLRVSATEVLKMSLPLHFVGEDASPAHKVAGVVVQHLVTEVEVAALPKDMPEYLEVDLSKLGPGDSVHLADITLPEGLIIVGLDAEDEESNLMLANAIHVAEEVEEEEDVEEGEEGDEDEEGAEDGDDDSDDEGDRD
jgi:large subunit ribosomal protein L25